MATHRIGIDLGTTNTVCYSFDRGMKPIPLDRSDQKFILPSVMMYKNGVITVGSEAKSHSIDGPDNVIRSSKRELGGDTIYKIENRAFTPVDVAAEILKTVKTRALEFFKDPAGKIEAVITIPAYFTAKQRAETKEAAQKAGIGLIQLLAEPTAAAIALAIEEEDSQRILVVDIGGGTSDICLLDIQGGVFHPVHTGGDPKLGGDDFDNSLLKNIKDYIFDNLYLDLDSAEDSDLDPKIYSRIMTDLRAKCEMAKIDLSTLDQTNIRMANLGSSKKQLNYKIDRKTFEVASDEIFRRIGTLLVKFKHDYNKDLIGVKRIIMVGGSGAIPKIQEMVHETFGIRPEYQPSEAANAVAKGAAVVAGQDELGVYINPVQTVARPIGIRLYRESGDIFSEIIPKDVNCPVYREKTFKTNHDDQERVIIQVYEGDQDSEKISNCKFFKEFIYPIPPNKEAGYEIHITFTLDENNLLIVTAENSEREDSKRSYHVSLQPPSDFPTKHKF